MNLKIGCALTVFVLFLPAAAWAHHSFTAVYDPSKKMTLTGTLTKMDWRNPHIEFSLEVKDDRGQVEVWVMEGMPPAWFQTRRVNKSDFEKAIGQTVVVEIVRAKDASRSGLLQQITFPDGKSVRSPEVMPTNPDNR